ncbi:hypothetical protein N7492_007319 [Penicillium capsulatum]|uniref:Uncharacterized protein n=1 Tax=Penicillium capsulatum TaxID=69766 RepID=A0A9W9LKQ1_9EURO|nr:hypothetical protein N7492_007319 [Penicillium capsulatum]KAJ6117160.1 hypothetical protein N7512_006885 [Penicillium capsulatum]
MSSTDLTDPSSLHSSKHDALPLVNSGSLEGFIKYIGILSASSETQFASAVLDQIHSQDEELKTLRKKIRDVEESKRTTVNDMFTANETERAKRREYAAQIESLSATINERESKIDEHAKNLGALQQEMAKLESANSQERAKLSQSAKTISTLQSSLKEKDQMIDQLKTAGSKLKSAFSSEKKKKEELEVTNTAMNAELHAVQGYIQKLENFRVQSSDIDENYV